MASADQHVSDKRPSRTRPVKVRDLMQDGPVLELDHDGQIYRLRITRNRKLILTK